MKNLQQPAFARGAFLLIFLLAVPVGFLLLRKKLPELFPDVVSLIAAKDDFFDADLATFLTDLPIKPTVHSAAQAKREHFFWLVGQEGNKSQGTSGVALDIFSDQALFNRFFPGYSAEVRKDRELWRDYFQRDFEPSYWLEHIYKAAGKEMKAFYAWTGCFDIFKRYGADVVALGNSEVFNGLIPDYLHDQIASGSKKLRDPRILVCSTGGMPMKTAELNVRELKRNLKGKKIPYLIWGYSFWIVYLDSYVLNHFDRGQRNNFFRYYRSRIVSSDFFARFDTKWQNWRLVDQFPPVNWEQVFPFGFQDIRALRAAASLLKQGESGNLVPAEIVDNPKALAAAIGKMTPQYGGLDGITEDHCDIRRAEKKFDEILALMEATAEKVIIYLHPANPLMTKAAPNCLFSAVVEMLERKRKPNVFISTKKWREWGLSYKDFLIPSTIPGQLRIDGNHTNYNGARRLTNRIAEFILSDKDQSAE